MTKFYKMQLKAASVVMLVLVSLPAMAQKNKTTYFLNNSTYSIDANPAFRPDRGYVSIPVLGGFQTGLMTKGFQASDIFYENDGELVTFMDESVDYDKFLRKLSRDNKFDFNMNIDLLGAGWKRGEGYWNVGVRFNTVLSGNMPKSMFELLREDGPSYYDNVHVKNLDLGITSYLEFGVGYSRPITDKLTVGAKVKFLTGIADAEINVREIMADADPSDLSWRVRSHATVKGYMKGLSSKTSVSNTGMNYISGLDVGDFGVAGVGMGIDLGATYQVLDQLKVSLAVLDLGFISWNKNNGIHGVAKGEHEYQFDGFSSENGSAEDQFGDIGDDLFDMLMLEEKEAKGRTKSLRSTINVGGEYTFNEMFSAGLLSSTRFNNYATYSEITLIGNIRPASWFSGALSYSMINSGGKTFGIALNFSPSWINFTLGSDYMILGTKKGVPSTSKAANAYFGMSIPIGRK